MAQRYAIIDGLLTPGNVLTVDANGNIIDGTGLSIDYVQSTGLSTTWGATAGVNTGAFNGIMGSTGGATWLLSGTSNGTFMGGIQLADNGSSIRVYSGASFFSFATGTLTATTFSGALTGNASSATVLQTARLIGDVSFNGSANIVPARVGIKDTRGVNTGPYDHAGLSIHFKQNTTDALNDGGTSHGVLHVQHWNDTSGGLTHQLGFTDNNNLFIRQATSATTWGAWTKIWHAGNDGAGSTLDADLLDGQDGTYFLDWNNFTNKPDPTITLSGDLSGSVTLTDLASGVLNATIVANSVELGVDTTGNYVGSLTGGTGVTISGTAGEAWSPTVSIGQDVSVTANPTFSGATLGNVKVGGSTTTNTITTTSGDLVIDSATSAIVVDAAMTVNGNLTVNGTTTTVNTTTTSIDDPIYTLGGINPPTFDDNKDRGIEFRWHTGTTAKLGFFGFDDSTGKFTFIPDGTNTGEVFSGAVGTIDANIEWASVLNKPDPVITLAGDLSGSVTLTDLGSGTLTATIVANSVALGTDTTGDYLASLTAGTGISIVGATGEGSSPTITNTDLGSSQAIFKNVAVMGQTTVVADNNNDTLTFAAGNNITILTDAATDTITIHANDTSVDWAEVQNKPDPIITLAGDLSGSVTLTDLTSGTLTATIVANSVTLGIDTTGDYVASLTAGTGISISGVAGEGWSPVVTNTDLGSSQFIFKNIAVAGQTTIVAESNNDTLTLIAGTNITITTDAATDAITINANDTSVDWAEVQNKPDPIITLGGVLSGAVTLTNLASGTLTAAYVPNSIALGTDTTGNFASSVSVSGNGITITGTAGEGTAYTVNSNATSAATVNTIVYRDASGNFSANAITAANYLITPASSTKAAGVAFQRYFNKAVVPGELHRLAEYDDGEGTIAIEIQVSAITAGQSGTSTYRFQGGYNVGANGLPGSYYRLYPINDGRGHGDGPDTGLDSNAWEVYIYGSTVTGSATKYGVAVHVPAGRTGKSLHVTITELKRGMVFTDKSGDAPITTFTDSGNIYSHRNLLVENKIGVGKIPTTTVDVNGTIQGTVLQSNVLTGTAPLIVASSTLVTNLNADLLDGQNGAWYQDWTNITNRPDPVITVNLTGDVSGSGNVTLTNLASGTINIPTTVTANNVALGTDTTGQYTSTVAVSGVGLSINAPNADDATAYTITSNATANNTASTIVARDVSGNFTAGVVTTSRVVSTVATGTAPLTVTSTTLVTNLNADTIDGKHAADLAWKPTVTSTAISKTLAPYEHCVVTADVQTITLPATPTAGWEVYVTVGAFINTTIARNGSNIIGLAENMTIDNPNVTAKFRYLDATNGWILI